MHPSLYVPIARVVLTDSESQAMHGLFPSDKVLTVWEHVDRSRMFALTQPHNLLIPSATEVNMRDAVSQSLSRGSLRSSTDTTAYTAREQTHEK